MKKILMVGIGIVFLMQGLAFSQSVTFTASCTIPEIPGVNAPPFAEESKASNETQEDQEKKEQKTEEKKKYEVYLAKVIQSEKKTTQVQDDGSVIQVIQRTLYSR